MSSRACVTWPSLTTISRPPSPSTRVRAGTLMFQLRLLPWVMPRRLPFLGRLVGRCAEWLGGGVESAERPGQGGAARAQMPPAVRQGSGVRRFHRAEAAVAAAVDGRAERAAAG